ncbi:MAG: response regulator [Nitrospira sp.]|nr:response regulator [Nitrospira sp.]
MPKAVSGLRVLVVDDDADMRMALADALIDAGYAVCTAGDGLQALEQLAKRRFDVIVTDYQMPRMNGAELLAASRKRFPITPVIIVSGAGPALEQVARERGAFAFLRKPCTPQTVVDMVRLAMQLEKDRVNHPVPSDSRSSCERT